MALYLQLRPAIFNIAQIPFLILLADFLTGFFHWIEDNYGSEKTPIIGKNVTGPNLLHHRKPRVFLENSWIKSADVSIVLTIVGIGIAWAFNFLTWQFMLVLFILLNANEVHKWSHRSRRENGKFITFLQKIKLIQTPKQHAMHHGGSMNTNYCVITNLLNPILEKLNVWRTLESFLKIHLKINNRDWVALKKTWK